jgi:uncharacterized protein YhaN
MRLKRLNVAGFGKLGPRLALSFAPGFNLLLAPNEAGKTTTLELITALLYGFGKRVGGAHPYEPWAGDQTEVGGELAYELDDGGEYALSRHLLKRGERLSLRDSAGREMDLQSQEPGQFHLGISKGVFQTVSRVQLDDLQKAFSGSSHKDYQDARQELLGYFFAEAATRGQVRNPVEVREDWEGEAAGLYHPNKNRGKADRELDGQLERAEAELAQARQREEQAKEAQEELESLAAEQAALNQRRGAAAQELEQAQAALVQAQEWARKTALQAEIAELAAKGLADESSEQRARDLEREAAAAEERARQAKARAAKERAKAGEGDPAQELHELNALEARLAGLKAREQEAELQKHALGRKWVALEQEWAMDLDALAGLAQDLPYRLFELGEAKHRAQSQADQARQARAALPPPPKWVLGLGLGVMAALVGIKGLIWSYVASWPWWAWALAGLLLVGGLGLGINAWLRRARAKSLAAQAESLGREMAEAGGHAAKLQTDWESAAQGLSQQALSAEPGRLSAALVESVGLLEQAARQAESTSRLAAESQYLARDLAQLAGDAAQGEWSQAMKQAKETRQGEIQAGKEAERLEGEAQGEQAAAQTRREDLSRLLADAGLADLEALRQARERARRVEQLSAKLSEVEERLAKMPESAAGSNDLAACEGALKAAQARLQDLQAKLGELSQRRGRLEQELKHLNQAQSAAQAEAALEELRRRRWDLARRHGVLLLAGACLERAMQRFRLEAQPSLLQKASEFLHKSSAGAYGWLGSDIFESKPKPGQDPDLSARPGPGAMDREAQALSRGTRDQLYLSLRLALAQEITQGREPAPLLLDDPLVNFDDERLAAALNMLMELARERQVLLLTCHQGQYELARGTGACNLLELA